MQNNRRILSDITVCYLKMNTIHADNSREIQQNRLHFPEFLQHCLEESGDRDMTNICV